MPHTPADIFVKWLSDRPDQARTAIAVDGDRLLADAGILGKVTQTDSQGRAWQLVVFRGDDLAFRLAYRTARCEKRVLVVLARSTDEGSKIDVSYLSDILSANEGGPPLDLSVPAVFRRICPKINFPIAELRRFKEPLLERLESVPKAVDKIVERWGRPDDWGRGQVAALVLLAGHPEWALSDIWPDEIDPAAAVGHGLAVMLLVPSDSPDLSIIRELLQDAVYPQVREYCFWFEQPIEDIAGYLLIRALAQDLKLQNPAVQIAGLQLFPFEMPLEKLEKLSGKVIAAMKSNPPAWRLLERRAEDFITPKRSEKLAQLLPLEPRGKTLREMNSPAMLFLYLRHCLLAFFSKSVETGLGWTADLASHPVLKADFGDMIGRRRQCLSAARLAQGLSRMENCLGSPVPTLAHADGLLDWYLSSGHHRLELEASRALHDLVGCEDEDIYEAGKSYLSGMNGEAAAVPGSLAFRIRARLDSLDAKFAHFVESDPSKLANDERSVISFLKDELKGELDPILAGNSDSRVWVLIFDGMRFDTWEDVVQPLLGEYFSISGGARFCPLPSYTLYARTSLLAGATAATWAANKSPASRDEAALFAKNIGLAAHEVKEKMRFVTDAETTKARAALGFTDKTARPVNVLIYPISDECHEYKGDLASFNDKIRSEILGNNSTGIRGILDDLLQRIKPGDLVFVTSDHGFIELPADSAVLVTQADVASHQSTFSDAVFYRYAKRFRPQTMTAAVAVEAGNESHYLCVGREWLKREGVGTAVRYSHGGLSLAEVVVPAIRLDRVTEKFAAMDLTGIPSAIAIDEDGDFELVFQVRNKGNLESSFEVLVRTNTGEQLLTSSGDLAPAASQVLKCVVHGAYKVGPSGDVDGTATVKAIELRLRFRENIGKWRDAADAVLNIPVKVHEKKTKLSTDALAGFDEV